MSNWLGVDIGNSGLKIARLHTADATISDVHRIDWTFEEKRHPSPKTSSASPGSPDFSPNNTSWLEELSSYLTLHFGIDYRSDPIRWIISSVRRDALENLQEFLDAIPAHKRQILNYRDLLEATPAAAKSHSYKRSEALSGANTSGSSNGRTMRLETHVTSPEKVGIDRLLAGLAAASIFAARPLVVIQVGTAVTVDLITAGDPNIDAQTSAEPQQTTGEQTSGIHTTSEPPEYLRFEGGAILPGIPMILRLLGQAADQLPQVDAGDLFDLPTLPGKNTEQAMRAGAVSSLIGGVQHLITRYRSKYGPELQVIMSGGDGLRLSPYIPEPTHTAPQLVMHGLMLIALRVELSQNV